MIRILSVPKASRVFSALVPLLFLVRCDDSEGPTAPARTTLAGAWSGTIRQGSCEVPLRMQVSEFEHQDGRFLTGRWETIAPGPACKDQGYVSGEVRGNDVSLGLTSELWFACSIVVEARRRGEDRLTGRFDRSRCTSAGHLEVVRDQ